MGSPIDEATFLNRARARFGEKYDYTQIIYKSYKTPIKIRCLDHPVRDIVITPEKHLQTSGGCKFCLRATRLRILTRFQFESENCDRPGPLVADTRVGRARTSQDPRACESDVARTGHNEEHTMTL